MNDENKLKISNLLNLLDDELKKQEEIEITENENKLIFDYLEKNGFLNIFYEIEYEFYIPRITEKNSNIDLWYKDINNNWIIKMYEITNLLNANSK